MKFTISKKVQEKHQKHFLGMACKGRKGGGILRGGGGVSMVNQKSKQEYSNQIVKHNMKSKFEMLILHNSGM